MLGYSIWIFVIIMALVINFGGLFWWYDRQETQYGYKMSPMKWFILFLGVISISVWLGSMFYMFDQADKPPTGITEWKGGQGPDTVCWYADKDNPDQVVSTGKTVVVIPDNGTTRYTWCSIDGTGVPTETQEGN